MPALLFSYSANALPADDASGGPYAHASGSESVLTRWHDYALVTITPQFTWAALPATNAAPNVLDQYGVRLDMPPLFSAGPATTTHVSLSVATGMVSDTPNRLASQTATILGMPQNGVERTVVTPSLVQQFDDGSTAKLSAVLAYQRYASLGLGMSQFGNDVQPASAWAASNTSYGAGARLDLGGPLVSDSLRWGAAYQSRVGMDPFAGYHGVFSDQGDFDIPANASLGVSYALNADVRRRRRRAARHVQHDHAIHERIAAAQLPRAARRRREPDIRVARPHRVQRRLDDARQRSRQRRAALHDTPAADADLDAARARALVRHRERHGLARLVARGRRQLAHELRSELCVLAVLPDDARVSTRGIPRRQARSSSRRSTPCASDFFALARAGGSLRFRWSLFPRTRQRRRCSSIPANGRIPSSSFRRRPESTHSSFRRRPESTPFVIPAKAGIHFDFAFWSLALPR